MTKKEIQDSAKFQVCNKYCFDEFGHQVDTFTWIMETSVGVQVKIHLTASKENVDLKVATAEFQEKLREREAKEIAREAKRSEGK